MPSARNFALPPAASYWASGAMDDANGLVLYQPTRALFSIYLAPGTDPAVPSIHDFRARLTHVCDGFPVPGALAVLGAAAINFYVVFTEQFDPVEHRDRDEPSRPLPPWDDPDDPIPF
jgi:hypothetical protein